MTTHQAITLAIACIGAVLGIVNTWHQISKNRVRIKVTPAHALPVGSGGTGDWTISIEVVNLSAFPLTIAEIGFEFHGHSEHWTAINPILADGGPWPRRLEPREAVSVFFDSSIRADAKLGHVRCAYVRTQCGAVVRGVSPALRQLINDARRRNEDKA